ncbi:MAG: serine/threonine-protein kinase [Lacipirellulaceae bacterium]
MTREASPAAADERSRPEGAAPPAAPPPRRPAAQKFLYSTGDRPLEGYTIKRGVGRGGFGEVYFATSDAGKEVALKLIRRNLDIELRGVRQCLNLKHPNLIALYDIRQDPHEDEWVVMEYVAGESLEQVLARHPEGMPVELAVAWLRGIAAGVAYLHENGIVHRDLKPANLFLDVTSGASEGPLERRVKIGDYGLSKFLSTSRRSGNTESIGTVHYMAPEISGGRYGREIDTYALSVIFYEMLTGRVPFDGESVGEVLMKHLTAEPDLARLAEPYRAIVARGLAKDPEARLRSVDEMVALLPGGVGATASTDAPSTPLPPPIAVTWSPVSRPPHTTRIGPQREPVWQAGVELLDKTRYAWSAWQAPPVAKGVVLLAGIAALIGTGAIFAVPMVVLPVYLVYYVVWAAFLQGPPDAIAQAAPVAAAAPKPSRPTRADKRGWRDAAMAEYRARPFRMRLRSLLGSMVVAALVATAGSAAAAPLAASWGEADPLVLGCWLAGVTTAGAWGVLVSSALTQAHFEDHAPARGLQALAGVGVGLFAFALAEFLGQGLPTVGDAGPGPHDNLVSNVLDIDLYPHWGNGPGVVTPPLVASVAYFGLVFALVRWWKGAEWVRRSRIGFWSVLGAALGAWLVTLIVWYPQPIGPLVAGLIAAATQAASPWLPPSRRVELARGVKPSMA